MARLLIHFLDAGLGDFRWASIDEDRQTANIDWQPAGADELDLVASQNPYPLTIFLPQQCVYLTSIELPLRAGRQILSAIDFQVEDQLAQDIELQHVAIGDSSKNPVAIAVVERELMQRCLDLAQSHALRLVHILPELFLCPWPGSGVVLARSHDGYLLRYGDYAGLKCHAAALAPMLRLVNQSVEIESITCYGGDGEEFPQIDGFELERKNLDEARPGFLQAAVIDLQQRDFQMSSAWYALGRAWKSIAILLAILLVIGGYNKAMALQSMERELAEIRQQQFELLQPHLPEIGIEDNLKKALIDRLQQLQSNQNEQGFLALMLEFTRARANFPEVEITRVGYQGKDLVFDISSTQLTKIETLLATVQKQGVNATLVSLNIKPERSSGRLVLSGGDDV